MKSGWQKYFLYGSIVIVGGIILFETIRLKNTGFEGKSLWDWMELLVIPLVLALGAFFFNRSERNTEHEIASGRQQDATVQAFIDRISDLLLKENLLTTKKKQVRNVARINTLMVLQTIDPKRRSLVLIYLHEAGLFKSDSAVIDLAGANLRGAELSYVQLGEVNLSGVDLHRCNLQGAFLQGIDLRGANLYGAKLSNVNLSDANLSGTDLSYANMQNAYLFNADLRGAFLQGANFSSAIMQGAKVSEQQLKTASSLKGATMPDGTIHE